MAGLDRDSEDALSYHSSGSNTTDTDVGMDDAVPDLAPNVQHHSLRRIKAHVYRLQMSSAPDLLSSTAPQRAESPLVSYKIEAKDRKSSFPTNLDSISENASTISDPFGLQNRRRSSDTAVIRNKTGSNWSITATFGCSRMNSRGMEAYRRHSSHVTVDEFSLPIKVKRPSVTHSLGASSPRFRYWKANVS
jgi:hypothetical protein